MSPVSFNRSSAPSQKPPLFQPPARWSSILYAFWKFSRPHTIVGTTLSTLGLFFIAFANPAAFVTPAIQVMLPLGALLACLCGNVYIVGLNQLEDISIDRVNKPHLPLASGEFSPRQGKTIVAIAGILSILIALSQGPILLATILISLIIGTAYSLPPLRLKRFPFWASLCIFTVRGLVVNLGLFLHFQQILNPEQSSIPSEIWLLTGFILIFTFAIAIFKDIPDLEGDRLYNINTFTVRLGQKAVFNLARWVLTVCYVGMIGWGSQISGINTSFLVITHGVALMVCWLLSLRVNLQKKSDIAWFYQVIWKLFFLEYIMFPLACLLA